MKRLFSVIFAVSVLGAPACVTHQRVETSEVPARPEQLTEKPVKFEFPAVERWMLPNGLVVLYRYDDELPRISGKLFLPGGSLYEPADEVGLASAAGSLMREGSIPGVLPEVLDKNLDDMAASIESSFGEEFGSVSFSCLSEDFDRVFPLVSQITLQPAIDEGRLQLLKKLALEAIVRRRDRAETMANMAFVELLYGKDSPYARSETAASVQKISRAEILKFLKKYVRPNGAIFALSGAVPRAKVEEAIRKQFADWQPIREPLPELPKVENIAQPGVYVLERDFDQATVLIGHLGPPRLTPDIYEMSIYNRVLGSTGFGSRLFDEIRTQLGLAYDVSGGLAPGAVAGLFEISIGTRNEGVVLAVQKSIAIARDTLVSLPDEERFREAKSAVQQSFIFRFDSPGEVVARAAQQELLKYPKDFDQTYLEKVSRVTPELVRAVGERWIRPDHFVVVIVGRNSPEAIAQAFQDEKLPVYRLTFDTVPKVQGKIELVRTKH